MDIHGRTCKANELHSWLRMPLEPTSFQAESNQFATDSNVSNGGSDQPLWKILVGVLIVSAVPSVLLASVFWYAWNNHVEFMSNHFAEPPLALIVPSEALAELVTNEPVNAPDGAGGEMEITPESGDMWERWSAEAYSKITFSENPYHVNPFPSNDTELEARRFAFQSYRDFVQSNNLVNEAITRKAFAVDFFGYWALFTAGFSVLVLSVRRG